MEQYNSGFTLVEIAMVLFIVTLLMAGLIPTISIQIEQKKTNETSNQLREIKEALIGFALYYNRLPCPASATSNGVESPVGGGNCTNFYNGFVPSVTLGLSGDNISGVSADAWGNRIHYAVTSWTSTTPAVSFVFTSTNGMKNVGISLLSPDLMVCSQASANSTSCSVANTALTSSPGVPVVIYSTGKNGSTGGTGTDEAENPNPKSADNDRIFASHNTTSSFDDLVTWISPGILYNRMVSAGKLP